MKKNKIWKFKKFSKKYF